LSAKKNPPQSPAAAKTGAVKGTNVGLSTLSNRNPSKIVQNKPHNHLEDFPMPKVALSLASLAIATMMAAATPAQSQTVPAASIHTGDAQLAQISAQAKKRVVKKRVVVKRTVVRRPAARRGAVVVRAPAVVGVPAVRTRRVVATAGRTCRTVTTRKRVGNRVVVSKTRRCS
jgi:hypothetical protein